MRGVVLETWDDWTEGTEFEPDVAGGPSVLVSLRRQLGALAGEPADPAGDARLAVRWTSYGQARNCGGGSAGTPPAIALACPAPPDLGAASADLGGAPPSTDGGGAIGAARPGCGCAPGGAGPRPSLVWLVITCLVMLCLATCARGRST